MPLILNNKHERLQVTLPAQPTEIQQTWQEAKAAWSAFREGMESLREHMSAELLAQHGTLSEVLERLDSDIGTVLPDDHTTIYYHRLTYQEQKEVQHLSTPRGEVSMSDVWMETCKRAVDGWDNLYDADLRLVPVPAAVSEKEQRGKITAIVEGFPLNARQTIAGEALQDNPSFLLNNWRAQWKGNSSLRVDARNGSSPATTVDATTATTMSDRPVMGEKD